MHSQEMNHWFYIVFLNKSISKIVIIKCKLIMVKLKSDYLPDIDN